MNKVLFGGAVVLWLVLSAATSAQQTVQEGTGPVLTIHSGVVFLGGIPHKIASIAVGAHATDVAVPATGTTPIQAGEIISFAGRPIPLGDRSIIATHNGYVYRQSDKDVGQMMEDMQTQIQAQAQAAMANASPDVVPDAVPSLIVETARQRSERESRQSDEARARRVDVLIGVASLLVAIVALERIPKVLLLAAVAFAKIRRVGVKTVTAVRRRKMSNREHR